LGPTTYSEVTRGDEQVGLTASMGREAGERMKGEYLAVKNRTGKEGIEQEA